MRRLRDSGVRVSIDDFGTRFASFGYLQKFSVTSLKLDQSFVRDLTVERPYSPIISAIVGIARGFDLHLIAEGVENPLQRDVLRMLGCDEMQGHLFGSPWRRRPRKRCCGRAPGRCCWAERGKSRRPSPVSCNRALGSESCPGRGSERTLCLSGGGITALGLPATPQAGCSSSATITRPRPARLAAYIAWSARVMRCSADSWAAHWASPALKHRDLLAVGGQWRALERAQQAVEGELGTGSGVSGSTSTNSSPPKRARVSVSRIAGLSTSPGA